MLCDRLFYVISLVTRAGVLRAKIKAEPVSVSIFGHDKDEDEGQK